ncbi:outer membrane beta-barrel protein [Pontibacter ruber]|uniref:Outer membrane beta-barrel protein n=1 Tax=Pontibacter ruber TaxID=1343895 RepID=A0ABW5CW34_9BACT|nr:outer membrane beta-barrel protein [Pontibacter ruber]
MEQWNQLTKAILTFILLLLSFFVQAQKHATPDTASKKLFVGVIASTVGYNLKYAHEPKGGDLRPAVTPYLKYKFSKRLSAQVGVSYDSYKFDVEQIYVESPEKLIYLREYNHTRGVAMPVTVNYTLLYPFRKLELYGTAMVTPIFSTSKSEKSERTEEVTTVTYSAKTSGINTFLTLGIGLAYPLSDRFDMYGNYYRLNRNFNNRLRPKDEYPYPGSLAIGINYKL